MRCIWSKPIPAILVVSLCLFPSSGIAQAVDENSPPETGPASEVEGRLNLLAAEVEEKGYGYRVADNPAMGFSLDELCGLVVPDGWQAEASFRDPGGVKALPASFDWRSDGLPAVRNQGGCGSCWAFATVGVLESQIMLQSGTDENLSEQYLVSCNESGWSCGGGWWAHDYHEWRIPAGEPEAGAVLEGGFPYQASNVPCNPPHSHPYRIGDWAYVPGNEDSVEAIKQAIYQYGPVGAAVAVGSAFQAYSGGVFDNDESQDINHAIVLVGWNDAYSWGGRTYGVWILRNSWGSGWGEGGYMYITYGTSRVGYSANYISYEGAPDFALVAPSDGATVSDPPLFSWTGAFDQYLVYTVFRYNLIYWSGYYPVYFWTQADSFTTPSNWWSKVSGSMPSYWTVCGYDGELTCAEPRSLTKGASALPGE
jgi:hypothetical protein